MMQFKKTVLFILQCIAFGLAAAFLFLLFQDNRPTQSFVKFSNSKPYSFNDAVIATAPAVINVYANQVYEQSPHPLFDDPLFRQFFGNAPALAKRRADNVIGSGVIMNKEGYILTNAHVVQVANDIHVTLNDNRQAQATMIGMDTDTDLAVLKIELAALPTMPIGDSSKLVVGDIVLAIGNPYDFGQTVTQGIVSAVSRKRRGISFFDDFIQTDADINLGNSGGALINAAGELVGINTAIISKSGGSEGIGLATPINQALDVMEQIINNGQVVRGWLGIEAQTLDSDIIEAANLKTGGVLISAIMRDGPAELAGLVPGDILLNIDGQHLGSPDHAIAMITALTPGDEVTIKILRGWQERELSAKIAQRPAIRVLQ